ncbi:MAG: motility protein A [Phycisphaerales bacterium]
MDPFTLIGLALGLGLIVMAIALGGSFIAFVDIPSILIVGGGCIASLLVAFPLANLFGLPKVLLKAVGKGAVDPAEMIRSMVRFAEVARRDGILALEGMTDEMEDDLLVIGVKMAVDGTDPDLIQAILDADIENMVIRHEAGKGMMDVAGKYAPAFGMIGTLVGLVAMLANMDDPSAIGAGMAAALLTTLYGAVVANCIFLPLSDKLALRNEEEILMKTIVLKGVMSIQAGDNPRVVEQKLLTFIPPGARASFGGEEGGGEQRKAA